MKRYEFTTLLLLYTSYMFQAPCVAIMRVVIFLSTYYKDKQANVKL